MYFFLKVTAKNKNSLNNFLFFIKTLKYPIKIIKNSFKYKKKKFLTVLKSPHVNKDAQEQFEFKFYSKEIMLWSPQIKILFLVLKKIVKTDFSGIQVKVFCFFDEKVQSNFLLNLLNPYNLSLKFFKTRIYNELKMYKTIHNYFNLCDSYGEISVLKRIIK